MPTTGPVLPSPRSRDRPDDGGRFLWPPLDGARASIGDPASLGVPMPLTPDPASLGVPMPLTRDPVSLGVPMPLTLEPASLGVPMPLTPDPASFGVPMPGTGDADSDTPTGAAPLPKKLLSVPSRVGGAAVVATGDLSGDACLAAGGALVASGDGVCLGEPGATDARPRRAGDRCPASWNAVMADTAVTTLARGCHDRNKKYNKTRSEVGGQLFTDRILLRGYLRTHMCLEVCVRVQVDGCVSERA